MKKGEDVALSESGGQSARTAEYIQTSSFIQKSNGDLKRRRQKTAYKDIKLEQDNYLMEIRRVQGEVKVEEDKAINSQRNSARHSQWSNTHFTTFKRKRLHNAYLQSDEITDRSTNKYKSPFNSSQMNIRGSCLKTRSTGLSNSKAAHRGHEQSQEMITPISSIRDSSNKKRNMLRNSLAQCNDEIEKDKEIQQLNIIKSEIDAMIKLKLNEKCDQITKSASRSSKREGDRNCIHSSRSMPIRRSNENDEGFFNKKVSAFKPNSSQEMINCRRDNGTLDKLRGFILSKGKGSTSSLTPSKETDKKKGNQRYSQIIDKRDSTEDLYEQIDQDHDRVTSSSQVKPILKSKKRALNAQINDKDEELKECESIALKSLREYKDINPEEQKAKDITATIEADSCKAGVERKEHVTQEKDTKSRNVDEERKEYPTQEKNTNAKHKALLKRERQKEDNHNDCVKTLRNSKKEVIKSIEPISNTHNEHNEDFIREQSSNTKEESTKEQFIDSKGNRYNLQEICKIIERTHQMTIQSKPNEKSNNPFNDKDYEKLIIFLNNANNNLHSKTKDTNPMKEMQYNLLSSLEQSIASNNKLRKTILSMLTQLKGELNSQMANSIQNKLSPITPFTSSHLKWTTLPLTSLSQSTGKPNQHASFQKDIQKYDMTFSRNHLKHKHPLTANTLSLNLSPKKPSNDPYYYLSMVKADISNYLSKKNDPGYQSSRSSKQAHSTTHSTCLLEKPQKCLTGLMPVNDLNVNYFV